MLIKLIVFLIRIRLGLKCYDCFQFANQKSNAVYFFTPRYLIKFSDGVYDRSGISLNWLLDPECKKMLIRCEDEQHGREFK